MSFIFYHIKKKTVKKSLELSLPQICLWHPKSTPSANPESRPFSPSHPALNLSHEHLSLGPLQWPQPLFLPCHLKSVKSQSNHVSPLLKTFWWLTTQKMSEPTATKRGLHVLAPQDLSELISSSPLSHSLHSNHTDILAVPQSCQAHSLSHCISVYIVASSGTTVLLWVSTHLPPYQWDLRWLPPKSLLSPYLFLLYSSPCHLYLTYHIFYMLFFFSICFLVFLSRVWVISR